MTKEDIILRLIDAKLAGKELYQTSYADGTLGAIIVAGDGEVRIRNLPKEALFYWKGSPVIRRRRNLTLDEAKELVEMYWKYSLTGLNVTGVHRTDWN